MGDLDNCLSAINNLLHLAPDYKDMILSSDYLANLLKNSKFKELLK